MMPSIHDVQITVNAENCCNSCCFPRRRKLPQPPIETIEKVDKVARRSKSNPT